MRLLVLGGTVFLGRAIATAALARGDDVTCFARGNSEAPSGATMVHGDRDRDDGLAPLADTHWDAIIDVTRQPGHARRAVRDLRTDHWVYISSGNAYARFDRPEQDESSPLCEPLQDDVMADMSLYGPAKVACEQAVQTTGSHTVVRAGMIAGAGDPFGRVGYYPWRFAHPTGDDVLVPELDFPTAVIEVADLAAWVIECARTRLHGVYNATGPTTTVGELVRLAKEITGSPATPRVVDPATAEKVGLNAWMGPKSLPLWVDDPSWRYFATMDTFAARAAGLTTRPLRETLLACLDSEEHRTTPRSAGLTDDEEREVRARLDRLAG